MPIHKMQLEGSLFTAKPVGYFDNVDARMWANALNNHAKQSMQPIVALVTMADVNRICPTVPGIFTTALRTPNVRSIVIAAGDVRSSQIAVMMDKLAAIGGIRVFPTLAEAERYAFNQAAARMVDVNVGGFSRVMQFAV